MAGRAEVAGGRGGRKCRTEYAIGLLALSVSNLFAAHAQRIRSQQTKKTLHRNTGGCVHNALASA